MNLLAIESGAMLRSATDYLLITLMLVASAALFWHAAGVGRARVQHKTNDGPTVWILCGSALSLFALIKGLNMLAFVGGWLRELTKATGSYDGRFSVQLMALGLIGLLLGVVLLALMSAPGVARRHWPLLFAVAILGAWGMARFVSLHAVDALVAELPWLRTGVEIALTSLILIYTLLAARKLGEKRVPSRRVKPRDPAPL